MKLSISKKPRKFKVGKNSEIEISDYGKVQLLPNEMISIVTDSGNEHDFTAKEWGFYATPSLNGRLSDQGFKSAIVKNQAGQVYLMTVLKNKIDLFNEYVNDENSIIIQWLDEL